jgi:hypothetical protein
MANSLTNYGQEVALFDDRNRAAGSATNNGGIAQLGTSLRLYDSTSTPAVDGSGFVEVAAGNGYSTGGITVNTTDYNLSISSGSAQVVLTDQTWTAVGGDISNIYGAYLTDNSNNILAWWERSSATTLADGDTLIADDLTIRLV